QHIGFEPQNWFKARMLEWHTLDSIPWLAAYYRRDPRRWHEKLPEIRSHLEHVGAHYLLLGRGTELVFDPADDDADDDDDDQQNEGASARPDAPAALEVAPPAEQQRASAKHHRLDKRRAQRAERRGQRRAAEVARGQVRDRGYRRRLHDLTHYRREQALH